MRKLRKVNKVKIDSYIRSSVENFSFDIRDGWGNENSLVLQGLGMLGKKRDGENAKRIFSNLLTQIPYECNYAGIACFYEMESGEIEVKDRIKNLMSELNKNFDNEDDEMALVFYTKYETKLGGKEHYQDVMNRYKAAFAKAEKNDAYFMASVIEGIDSIDQAIYEYYDGLKKLFKETLAHFLSEDEHDLNDKALAAFAILKACRLKVILTEKYEEIGLKLYDEVVKEISSNELNRGAVLMMHSEKALR